jgi:hypothetical protein
MSDIGAEQAIIDRRHLCSLPKIDGADQFAKVRGVGDVESSRKPNDSGSIEPEPLIGLG